MNPEVAAADFPVCPLLGRGGQEARVPGKGHRNRAAIHEVNDQTVFRALHMLHALACITRLSSHAMPPGIQPRDLPRVAALVAAPLH